MSKLTLMFKDKVLKVFPLGEGDILIGSDPDCLVHIDSLSVQDRHASVTTHGNNSVLRDLGSTDGTFVNGERINERTLNDQDVILIGKFSLTFEQEEALEAVTDNEPLPGIKLEPKAGQAQSAWLQLLNGPNVGKTISLNRSLTNLGKQGVQTAVIARRNDGYFLSHLEGKEPPTVDGQSIGDSAYKLSDGQLIQMGNIRMLFSLQ